MMAAAFGPRLLNPVDQHAFVIGLPKTISIRAARHALTSLFDAGQCGPAINLRLPGSEKIEIGAIKDIYRKRHRALDPGRETLMRNRFIRFRAAKRKQERVPSMAVQLSVNGEIAGISKSSDGGKPARYPGARPAQSCGGAQSRHRTAFDLRRSRSRRGGPARNRPFHWWRQ